MKVSRSGYYKWLKNKENLNNYELNRKDLGILIKDIHTRKPSYGYHRINAIIRRETGWIVSDNLVHKVCKLLNIKSKTRHYKYKKPGEESIKYSNQICGNWNTTRPFEKIVSDTTTFWFRKRKYDWTFYLDVFNNEIVGYDVRDSMHGNGIINHREALNDMLNNLPDNPFIVILDHLEDPHNFGAIIRTCEAAGTDYIVIPKDRSVSINSTVMKTSVGALDNVKIVMVTNLNTCINELKKKGIWIVGTDMENSSYYDEIDYKTPTALVIGSEGFGMSNLVKKNCDFIAKIPMKGKINSLNASVAAGIMIYEVVRQRKTGV